MTVVDAVVRLAGVGAKALVVVAARAAPEERCRRRGQVRFRMTSEGVVHLGAGVVLGIGGMAAHAAPEEQCRQCGQVQNP